MRVRGRSCLLVAGGAVVILAAGCGRPAADYLLNWDRGVGYFSMGMVAQREFRVDDRGIDPGSGFSITMPPLFPISAACYAGLVVMEIEAEGDGTLTEALGPAVLTPGIISGVSDETRKLISEVTFELTFSRSTHDDRDFDGRLDYKMWQLGVRLGGPARYVPSYTVSAGWAWHNLDFDSRPNADAQGLYLSGGLRFFATLNTKLTVEYVTFYYAGDAAPGLPEDGARHLGVYLTGAWYF